MSLGTENGHSWTRILDSGASTCYTVECLAFLFPEFPLGPTAAGIRTSSLRSAKLVTSTRRFLYYGFGSAPWPVIGEVTGLFFSNGGRESDV